MNTMNNRRSGRAHKPSRKVLESGDAIAVIEGNADDDGDESMIDNQHHGHTADDPREAAKAARLAKLEDQKRRRALYKEKHDKRRQEERYQAKKEGMTLWQFQQRQRAEGMARNALRLEEEAAELGLLTPDRLGKGMFDLPSQSNNKTVATPHKTAFEIFKTSTSWLQPAKLSFFEPKLGAYKAPTTMKKKASKYQQGPGRGRGNFVKEPKRSLLMTTYQYRVKKNSERRETEADVRRRKRFATAVADKDMEDLTIGMFNTLVIEKHIDVTYHREKVASGVGVWDMFDGKPNWVIPFPIMDPSVLDYFPPGQPFPCLMADKLKNTLSNSQYRREFSESLGMSVARLKAWINRVGEPKLGAIRHERDICDIASYEQYVKSGGNNQKYISELQRIQENHIVVHKVQALRKQMAKDNTEGIMQRSFAGTPHIITREQLLRRQYILRERAYRNVVKIHQLRQEADIDMNNDDDCDCADIKNPSNNRVAMRAGFQLKPVRPKRGAITHKQMEIREAEAKAIRGDAKPTHSEADIYTEEGDAIRCICGGLELDDNYTGKWIQCDECDVWQHNVCVGAPLDDEVLEDMEYFCEECRPDDPIHEEYFEALERGEEIWDARINKNNEEEKRKRAERRKKRKSKGDVDVLMDNMVGIKIQDDGA